MRESAIQPRLDVGVIRTALIVSCYSEVGLKRFELQLALFYAHYDYSLPVWYLASVFLRKTDSKCNIFLFVRGFVLIRSVENGQH